MNQTVESLIRGCRHHAGNMWSEGWYTTSMRLDESADFLEKLVREGMLDINQMTKEDIKDASMEHSSGL